MTLVLKDETSSEILTKRACPKCKTGRLDTRVPRAPMVKLFLGFLPLQRYRCYKCNKKSYIIVTDR